MPELRDGKNPVAHGVASHPAVQTSAIATGGACATVPAKPYCWHDKRSRSGHAAFPALQAVFAAPDRRLLGSRASPGIVTQGGRTAVVNSEGEKLSILDLGLITAIELNSPNGG